MRKAKLNSRELDRIGKRLIVSSSVSETEIDRIADAPHLFDQVRMGIEADGTPNAFEPRLFPTALLRRKLVFASSIAGVLCVAVFGFFVSQKPTGLASHGIQTPATHPAGKPGETTAVQAVAVNAFTQGRVELDEERSVAPDTEPKIQQAIYRSSRPARPSAERASFKPVPPANEFLPVTYTGDAGESAKGGRVVRVDVPRSTLFAMGFNVSLENESPTVKADLLIGPDGVTRAVRLVE